MRISRTSFAFAITALLAWAPLAMAQDSGQSGKSDTEVPPDVAGQLGPRVAPAQGQPQQQQGSQAQVVSKHGDWEVQCTDIPAGEGSENPAGGKACGMVQMGFSDKNKDIGIRVIVSIVKQADKKVTVMRVLAPIGVYLPTGIPMEIDGTALPGRMQFTRCVPGVCQSEGAASPESLGKLKKGKAITFFLYDAPGSSYPVKLKLAGFGDALAALGKL